MPKLMKGLLGIVAIALVAVMAINFFSNDELTTTASTTGSTKVSAPVVEQKSEPAKVAEAKSEAPVKQVEEAAPVAPQPQITRAFKDGVDYRTLSKPVLTDVETGQIEVAEVFWYGCPHCYNLEPIVTSWKKTLGPDAVFVRRPGFFGPNIWQTHAQLYYTVRTMGIEDKVHDGIFNEIQNRRNMLKDADAMADFLNERYGIDKKEFVDQFNSFGVNHLLQQAFAKLKGYDLTGVPALIIDGRYVVEPGKAGSLNNMPVVADFLIEKARKERASESR